MFLGKDLFQCKCRRLQSWSCIESPSVLSWCCEEEVLQILLIHVKHLRLRSMTSPHYLYRFDCKSNKQKTYVLAGRGTRRTERYNLGMNKKTQGEIKVDPDVSDTQQFTSYSKSMDPPTSYNSHLKSSSSDQNLWKINNTGNQRLLMWETT